MISKIQLFLSLLFIFGGVHLLVISTSNNDSFGVKKSFADLYFYQSESSHTYNNSQITSPLYPLETVYEKVKVSLTANPPVTPVTITVNNITIHSH